MKKSHPFAFGLLFAILSTQSALAADYTNSIGMKFKDIPAGSFYMGSCKLSAADKEANKKRKFMDMAPKLEACPSGGITDNEASDGETPQHKVRISKGFQMGVYEVTLGQFKKYIASSSRDDLITNDFIKDNSHGDDAAVTHVSWNDAQSFIKWLNEKEGGNHYRLPTEAQWEYAARAGTRSIYSWGNDSSQAGSYAWYDENTYYVGRRYAHAVGTKKPNPWGLYDMHGNVREWVQDWYDKNYYSHSASTDPQGASTGRLRVSRGGSWISNARALRSAFRGSLSPSVRDYLLGFRLMRKP